MNNYHQALEILKGKILATTEDSYDMFEQLLQQAQPLVCKYKPQRSRQSSFGMKHFSNQYG